MKIVIDGTIGSGKTTQLDLLEKAGWDVKREPISEWPLDLFYRDPSRWAFLMHMAVLRSLKPSERTVHERCPLSTAHVFWQYVVDKKLVTPEENELFMKYYDEIGWQPDVYILITKKPEMAWEHIQKRGQAGDSGVTLEYLKELQEYYSKMVTRIPCKMLVVNGNRDPSVIHKQILEYLETVVNGPATKVVKPKQCTDMCNMS
jgi:deoxyadenosine/deoxycytidine kinase